MKAELKKAIQSEQRVVAESKRHEEQLLKQLSDVQERGTMICFRKHSIMIFLMRMMMIWETRMRSQIPMMNLLVRRWAVGNYRVMICPQILRRKNEPTDDDVGSVRSHGSVWSKGRAGQKKDQPTPKSFAKTFDSMGPSQNSQANQQKEGKGAHPPRKTDEGRSPKPASPEGTIEEVKGGKEAPHIRLRPFPPAHDYRAWKMHYRKVVTSSSAFPEKALEWILEQD